MYCAGVETLDLSNLSSYDQGCNEEFQNAMKNYFEGKASKEEALDLFYKAVTEKYPELTYKYYKAFALPHRCLPDDMTEGRHHLFSKNMCNKNYIHHNIPVGR